MVKSEMQSQFVAAYVNEGLSETAIGKRFGVGRIAVRNALDRAKVRRRRRGWGKSSEIRKCRQCGDEKPIGAFSPAHPEDARPSQQRTYICRECRATKKRERGGHLDKYGLDLAGYDRMLSNQGGGCGICGRKPVEGKRFDVDHDHATERVRGLLCRRCNKWLAAVEESGWVDRARSYLART